MTTIDVGFMLYLFILIFMETIMFTNFIIFDINWILIGESVMIALIF